KAQESPELCGPQLPPLVGLDHIGFQDMPPDVLAIDLADVLRDIIRNMYTNFHNQVPVSCRVSHERGMIVTLANSHRSVKGEHPSGRGLIPDASGSPWGGDSLDSCLSLQRVPYGRGIQAPGPALPPTEGPPPPEPSSWPLPPRRHPM